MSTKHYRYGLPKRAIKGDCPQCGPKHRRTLSRYVDSETGKTLPEEFGRCDRENNCGYHLSPYQPGPWGQSYANEVFEHWKTANPLPAGYTRQPKCYMANPPTGEAVEQPIYTIPAEVFQQTLGHDDANQFAVLLRRDFGREKADELLERFHVGTSKRWTGATVFWIIDEQQRVRGGQVVLFKENWHRAEAHVDSAKNCLAWQYRRRGESIPAWLEHNETWPVPFGLHQLSAEPLDKPVAIVEACKTAIVCAGHSPQFVWLAIGSKSYPTAKRLAALRDRAIMLYPDLKAYADWTKRADALRAEGFNIRVSSRLEDHATDGQLKKGLDMADFLLTNSSTSAQEGPETVDEPLPASEPLRVVTTLAEWKHGTILRPDPSQLEYL